MYNDNVFFDNNEPRVPIKSNDGAYYGFEMDVDVDVDVDEIVDYTSA